MRAVLRGIILISINCSDREKWPWRLLVGIPADIALTSRSNSERILLVAQLSFPNAYLGTDRINMGWFGGFTGLIMRETWGKILSNPYVPLEMMKGEL